MHKKYIFADIDGTLIDHSKKEIPKSTLKALELAKENGHEIIINTGRPPCLLYGIDKKLGLDSYIAANGRYGVHHGEVILNKTINKNTIEKVVTYFEKEKIDLAFEGMYDFKLQSNFDTIYQKFSEHFSLTLPELEPNFYKENDIYQITLYYTKPDFKKFEKLFPDLQFAFSCKYGIDVNTKGGLKEEGIIAYMNKFDISLDDIIVIGDGYNDISMFEFAKHSIVMGNADEEVKQYGSYVTDDVSNDGFYKAMKHYGII